MTDYSSGDISICRLSEREGRNHAGIPTFGDGIREAPAPPRVASQKWTLCTGAAGGGVPFGRLGRRRHVGHQPDGRSNSRGTESQRERRSLAGIPPYLHPHVFPANFLPDIPERLMAAPTPGLLGKEGSDP